MPHAQPKQYFAATHRAVANADAIEWEDMPSFAGSLAQRLVNRPRANDSAFMGVAPATSRWTDPWEATLPAPFDDGPVSEPFRESLEGLATREVIEPDVFRHFFGPATGD